MSAFKNGWWHKATRKKLGKQTEPKITPQVLIFHTIVGTLSGAYSVFKRQGYYGDESTFGIAGPWDKANGQADGEVWQFQTCLRQADAQFDGNAYGNSIETSDGGNPHHPWSSAEMDAMIDIGVDWIEEYKRKPRLVPHAGDIGDAGFGYHELRPEWNKDGHVCPGPVREGQLRQIVIPKIRARVNGTKIQPARPSRHYSNDMLDVDGIFGLQTVAALQRDLMKHGHGCGCTDGQADGVFGPATRRALQEYLAKHGTYHGAIDGDVGPKTVEAWKEYLSKKGQDGMHMNGVWGHGLTRALQRALKVGKF